MTTGGPELGHHACPGGAAGSASTAAGSGGPWVCPGCGPLRSAAGAGGCPGCGPLWGTAGVVWSQVRDGPVGNRCRGATELQPPGTALGRALRTLQPNVRPTEKNRVEVWESHQVLQLLSYGSLPRRMLPGFN